MSCTNAAHPIPDAGNGNASPVDASSAGAGAFVDAGAAAGRDAGAAADRDAGAEDGSVDAGCSPAAGDPSRITLASLLHETVDLGHLTQLPRPSFATRLASSHDRASDTARPGDSAWFANRDFIELRPREPAVLLDVDGPGAIVRIWSASPAGVLRIYLDGGAQPVVEADLKRLLRGEIEPFTAPFGFVASGGHNLYFPIPFARGCRVTLTSEQAATLYYQLTYREYDADADVESFGPDALASAACMRDTARRQLAELRSDATRATGERLRFELTSGEGRDRVDVEAPEGGGMLTELRLFPEGLEPEFLRGTVLTIAFDGQETVRAPIGDFFGVGLGLRSINSLPVGATEEGVLVARWPMPFAQSATIRLQAATAQPQRVALEVVRDERVWDERSLYFHAQWRAPEILHTQPLQDWMLAEITGEGFYAGDVLNVYNSVASWWGEGDEKIWVDGEGFPSQFGTGTEDYFGFAWCSNEPFSTAYVGQPLGTSRANFGFASLYRFHVLDPIRFSSALRFDLEVQHWGDAVDMTYDALSFWYARPGSVARGMASDLEAFALPETSGTPPDVAEGLYRCGG